MRFDRRPLLDNPNDAPLFVDRDGDLVRLRSAVRLGFNASVAGEPGTGKSSLLRQLQWRERTDGTPTVFLSSPGPSTGPVLSRLYAALWERLGATTRDPEGLPPPAALEGMEPLTVVANLADLSSMLPRVLVLVDDVSVELGRALFGGLRDDLWRINVSWVVATRGVDADELLAPPVDAFFETVIDLGPMPKDAVVELLARRWTGEEPTVSAAEAKMLAEHAGGNPRRLIDLAREVVLADRSVDEIVAEFTALDDRLQVVSPQARTLAGELAGRGVAGPSDEALQQRMGLSRPRLIQLFSELEQAGIVHRLVQTAAGPGRPKQVYQLVPLHAHPSPHLTAGSGR